MARYFDEVWPEEEAILKIGLEQAKRHKRERMTKVFCIGNGESRIGFDLNKLRKYGNIYGCNAIYRDFMPDVLTAVDQGIMHEIYHAGVAQKIPCYFRDWTKVPAMTYESMLLGGMNKIEAEKHIKDIVISNERGEAKEYVMHGSSLSGIVKMLKKDGDKIKKNVNHATIKVSWIHEPDYSHTLSDIQLREDDKHGDHGWACGASAGFVAIQRERPKEVYLIGHDLYSHNNKVNNIYKSTKHYVAKENGPTPAVNWIKQWKTLFDWNPDIMFVKVNKYNDGRDEVSSQIEEWDGTKNLVYADYSTLDNLL